MKEIYIRCIAEKLQIKEWQVENCVELFADGATIPFVSRYRKERTGGLDEVEVAEVRHWSEVFTEMEKRKTTILETIESQGKLSSELRKGIENCVDATALEDMYLPYRPKRRTRATVAKELGLEPLADKLWDIKVRDPYSEAKAFVKGDVADAEAAIAGAKDIIAERLGENAAVRDSLRQIFSRRRLLCKKSKSADSNPEAPKYRSYFDFSMPLDRMASHQLLAVLRAESEGILSLKIDADPEACGKKIYYEFSKGKPYPTDSTRKVLNDAIDDSFKRLLVPSITTDTLKIAKEKADVESIRIFGENLRQLLLASPVGGKRTMAIDPGFRTGCKVVCLDETGALLHTQAIFPHPPVNDRIKAIQAVAGMIEKYKPEVIAVGSGTAGRETEEFLRKVPVPEGIKVYKVNEDGASIYSASEIARKEFPEYDLTVRGAVSIGRRLMDPLSELVKIDPKSLGVGQYQHDVDQALLREKLDNTVESCVNSVGVNLNTASEYLLAYVSGVGPGLAANIVAYRNEIGSYTSRAQLKKVKRLGDKAFEQCAGFLRIADAANPLDNSAVHPESYHIVDRMAADLGVSPADLVSNPELCSRIVAENYVEADFGLPTINDIISELRKPSRDPRTEAQEFSFADDIHDIEDLHVGMELPGIVTNITAFGAFVNIGVHENGLIHVSQMGVRGLSDPSKVLRLNQKIKVGVISVDLERKRIGLRLC